MKNQYVRRTDRYAQFVTAVMQLEYEGIRPSVASVCRRINMAVSTHARSILNDLAEQGYLWRLQEVHWNGKEAIVYLAKHETLREVCPDWYEQTAKIIGIQLTLPLGRE